MGKVKEYKGVIIYINTEGEFYADAISNSEDFKKKTFNSLKLQSIEKAIDNFTGQEIEDGEQYYEISIYEPILKSLKITKKVGNRIFFNDNTDSSSWARKNLYPKKIDETKEFQELEVLFQKIKENKKEVKKLYEYENSLKKEAENKLKLFRKVNIS